mgnify:CR=1 FL=1
MTVFMHDFAITYRQALEEQAPVFHAYMTRQGTLREHIRQTAEEANRMLAELTANAPKWPDGLPKQPWLREAEEAVWAAMLDFPDEEEQWRQVREAMRAAAESKPAG